MEGLSSNNYFNGQYNFFDSEAFSDGEHVYFDDDAAADAQSLPHAGVSRDSETREPESLREIFAEVIESRFELGNSFLLNDPLDIFWDRRIMKAIPFAMPFVYLSGMINFAFAAPIRASLVVITLLNMLYHVGENLVKLQFSQIGKKIKSDGLIFLGSLGELGSNVVGLICPPLAYKIDAFIQKNRTINSWYSQNAFTIWSSDLATGNVRAFGLEIPQFVGNEHRMEEKRASVEEVLPEFKSAKVKLEKYVAEDELDSMMPEVLDKIAMRGFLNVLSKDLSLEDFIDYAYDRSEAQSSAKENLVASYNGFKEFSQMIVDKKISMADISNGTQFKKRNDGDTLDKKQLNRAIAYKMLLDGVEADEVEEFFKNGLQTQNSLKAQLEGLKNAQLEIEGESKTLEEAVEQCYSTFKKIVGELTNVDREMYTIISKAAYEE